MVVQSHLVRPERIMSGSCAGPKQRKSRPTQTVNRGAGPVKNSRPNHNTVVPDGTTRRGYDTALTAVTPRDQSHQEHTTTYTEQHPGEVCPAPTAPGVARQTEPWTRNTQGETRPTRSSHGSCPGTVAQWEDRPPRSIEELYSINEQSGQPVRTRPEVDDAKRTPRHTTSTQAVRCSTETRTVWVGLD